MHEVDTRMMIEINVLTGIRNWWGKKGEKL
jgi:hypothetical protein